MLKIRTLAQRLTHCYCSINTNLVRPKTEWKRQHITQRIKLFDYWGTYCKCLHHMTHIMNVNVCNSQSTVQHAQHWRWKNYAQLPDDNIMSCVFCRSFAAKKKNWGEQQQTAKHAIGTIVTKNSYWWEEFRAYLICMQHGNFHTCHRPTLLLLCTTAHEHHKINSPQSLYTATLHASTGGYALWTLSWRLSTQSCIANNATRIYATCTTMIVRCVYVRMHECTMHKLSHLAYMYM